MSGNRATPAAKVLRRFAPRLAEGEWIVAKPPGV